MTAERFFTSKYGVILSALICTALWGSAFPVIKLSYEVLNIQASDTAEQVLFAGYRFFLAAIFIMLFMVAIKKSIRLKVETIKPLLAIGLFQTFLQYVLFYIGLSLSTGIQGSIIAGTTSFFQILLAHFMYKDDKFSMRKWLGLAVGFTGVILVNITQGSFQFQFGIGEICLTVAMVSAAFGNILARNSSLKWDVMYVTSFQMLFGGLGLLLVGATFAGVMPFQFTTYSTFLLIYLALLSSIGFVVWNNVMKYNFVGKVSMYLFLIPVFGVFFSSILLNEVIHVYVVLGLLFVTTGIIIVNRKKQVVDHSK